jgi:hypothetical protein
MGCVELKVTLSQLQDILSHMQQFDKLNDKEQLQATLTVSTHLISNDHKFYEVLYLSSILNILQKHYTNYSSVR